MEELEGVRWGGEEIRCGDYEADQGHSHNGLHNLVSVLRSQPRRARSSQPTPNTQLAAPVFLRVPASIEMRRGGESYGLLSFICGLLFHFVWPPNHRSRSFPRMTSPSVDSRRVNLLRSRSWSFTNNAVDLLLYILFFNTSVRIPDDPTDAGIVFP